MAHNLKNTPMVTAEGNLVDFWHFVYSRKLTGNRTLPMPWHGLGNEVVDPFTAKQGLAALGGPETVRVVPLTYALKDGTAKVSETTRLVVNQADEEYAGVGRDYVALQEDQVAEVMDIAMDGKAKLITMGRLGRGERFFASADLGPMEIVDPTGSGFKELVNHYLVTETSHDKSRAYVLRLTTVVPVCQNTISLGERSQAVECRLLHTGSLEAQASVVAKAVARTGVLVDKFEEAIKLLFTFSDLDSDDVVAYTKLLYPHPADQDGASGKVPSIVQNKRDLVHAAYEAAPGCKDTPDSGFRLYRAATRANGKLRKTWSQEQFQPASVEFRERAYSSVLKMMEVVA